MKQHRVLQRAAALVLSLVLSLLLLPLPALALTTDQTRELLEQYYIDAIPAGAYDHATVEEIVDSLGDPYTQYLTAKEYQAFLATMSDKEVVGIGVALLTEAQGGRIATVYPDTPAAEAGLQSGDLILSVDGVSLAGCSNISQLIQGEAGTCVTLTVMSGNGVTRTLTLIRRKVTILQTVGALVDGHIGTITCTAFGNETYGHFRDIITRYEEKADLWLIDLRNNSGGVTQAAVNAAACFIGNSIMSYFRDGNGASSICIPDQDEIGLTDKPVIILVNESTASAAELFTSAMRDYRRAIVIGSRTYGKGVAQVMLDHSTHPDFFSDGDALKVTAYRFFAPYCATNDHLGVLPTLLVDSAYAEQVALLLCAQEPKDSLGYFRLDLCGMSFYIDGSLAVSDTYIDAFQELLFSVPPAGTLYTGRGGGMWMTCSTEDTALLQTGSLDCRTFSDVQSSPYRTAIQSLAIYGIAEPVSGDRYQPTEALTRGELCLMLARLMNGKPGAAGSVHFSDIPEGTALSEAVDTLYSLGFIKGYGDGSFRPDQAVTHQEFCTILARTAAFLELNAAFYYQIDADELPLEDDAYASYASWARRSVWLCSYLGVLWDSPETVASLASTTREEAAQAVYSLLRFCGLVPFSV